MMLLVEVLMRFLDSFKDFNMPIRMGRFAQLTGNLETAPSFLINLRKTNSFLKLTKTKAQVNHLRKTRKRKKSNALTQLNSALSI